MQAFLRDVLASDGHHVEIAASLRETLERAKGKTYSAVLIDTSVLRDLAEDLLPELAQLAPEAATIIVTGDPELEQEVAMLRRGDVDYLVKPVRPASLRASLARIGKLREAERRASEVERLAAIGQMMTVLSHESRNLFQECVADLEMLERRIPEQPEAMPLVKHLQQTLDRMHCLFEDVRDYAAPIKLLRKPCDLSEILQDAWLSLTTTWAKRNVRLKQISSGLDLCCDVDAFRIEQVFRNLLDNALAACPDPVEITIVWSETRLNGQPAVQVVLKDNGPGLSPEQRRKIFAPFFTTKPTGTGLGLSITQRIVESHGGRITTNDTGWSGAEFVITLPRRCPH